MRAIRTTGRRPGRRRLGAAAAAAAALLANGCALKPAPTHESDVAAALPATTQVPGGWVSDAVAGPVANGWLAELADPQLDALVAEAIANNTDLREAAARVVAAQQAAVVAGSASTPGSA